MSRHDAYTPFGPRPGSSRGGRAPALSSVTYQRPSTTPRLDLPSKGARSFVAIEEEWRARQEAKSEQPPATGGRSTRSGPRRRSVDPSFKRAAQVWELVGWIVVALLLTGAAAALLSRLPGWSVEAPARGTGAARPSAPTSGLGSGADNGDDEVVPATGSALPQQAAAPEVVALMVGSLADTWTYESIDGETTLRVQVDSADIGQAFLRASLALSTPSGRRVWNRLGASRLELRSAEAAISLQVAGSASP